MGKQIIALLALGAVLTGCGGGGGGSSTPAALTPTAQVQARDNALDAATKREDAAAIADFYSDSYQGPNGETKAQAVQTLTDMFQTVDFVDIQSLDETATPSENGQEVVVAGSYQFTLRNKETGEQGVFQGDSSTVWVKEPDAWRIKATTSGELVQIASKQR